MFGRGRRRDAGEQEHRRKPKGDGDTRQVLALTVVCMSSLGIMAVAVIAIIVADTERGETAQLVLGSVIPVFGTWTGTVLAFYFAQKGQELQKEATENAFKLGGRFDPQTPVRQAMIQKSQIVSHDLGPGDDPGAVELRVLLESMQSAGRQRIPILAESGAVLYIVHDSTIVSFANTRTKNPRTPAGLTAFTEKMADLLAETESKKAVEAFGSVGPDAVLADARKEMRAIERCNDVFVTTNGRKNDPMIGWLTNTDLAEQE